MLLGVLVLSRVVDLVHTDLPLYFHNAITNMKTSCKKCVCIYNIFVCIYVFCKIILLYLLSVLLVDSTVLVVFNKTLLFLYEKQQHWSCQISYLKMSLHEIIFYNENMN